MKKTPRSAYQSQKDAAKARGIPFRFTYDEWVAWWFNHLGPDWFERRGCRRGQYVMARHGDEGVYEDGNVSCILSEINHTQYNVFRKKANGSQYSKLSPEIVRAIFVDENGYDTISAKYRRFGVTKHRIQCIKTKRYYTKYTNDL